MNCLTVAMRIKREINKNFQDTLKFNAAMHMPMPTSDEAAAIFANATTMRMAQLKDEMILANEISTMFSEIRGSSKTNWQFITIRPNLTTTWVEFKQVCDKYLSSKRWIDGSYSYEQKGESLDTVGTGFHLHIIADTTWRSKAECLRDTINAFKSCCAPNCIKVIPTKTPQKLIKDYLVDYKSDDDHKEVTQVWDALWRDNLQLPHLHNLPLSST